MDVVAVGVGPGGEYVAERLAGAGLDVVAIEAGLVGGECPYWGCVPSKMMIRAADLLAEGRRIPGIAGWSTIRPDWAPVARRIRDEATDDWDDAVAVQRLEESGARFVRGWGRLDGPGRVVAGEHAFEASRAVVLNPGTVPWVPPVPGLAEAPYWTNHQAIECEEPPASLLVLGGGAIGLELAQVFSRFGSQVTVVEVADRLLAPEEPESSALITSTLTEEGIASLSGATIERVTHDDRGITLQLAGGRSLSAERLLVAAGRRPDLAGLGVATIGLDDRARAISVDERLRAAPGVWAIGDVTGVGAFTHVSMYQGRLAASDILGDPDEPADYRAVPRVTFTDPEIGSVGLTEAAAREAGINVGVGLAPVEESARGWIHKAGNRGLIKLVADRDRGTLVGATSAGPTGGEVLGLLVLAVHAEVPVTRLRQMIYAYPTFHRTIEAALEDLGPV